MLVAKIATKTERHSEIHKRFLKIIYKNYSKFYFFRVRLNRSFDFEPVRPTFFRKAEKQRINNLLDFPENVEF